MCVFIRVGISDSCIGRFLKPFRIINMRKNSGHIFNFLALISSNENKKCTLYSRKRGGGAGERAINDIAHLARWNNNGTFTPTCGWNNIIMARERELTEDPRFPSSGKQVKRRILDSR